MTRHTKIALGVGGVLIVGGIVYGFGLYTYFVRTEVQEALPTATDTPSRIGAALTPASDAPIPAIPPLPAVVARGSFVPIDAIHKGSGEAIMVNVAGTRFLRLENFQVTNGPDLHVYLSTSEKPTGDLASLGAYLDLGLLKGNVGNQNYALSDDLDDYRTAVIWCKRFGVLFSYAVMEEVSF